MRYAICKPKAKSVLCFVESRSAAKALACARRMSIPALAIELETAPKELRRRLAALNHPNLHYNPIYDLVRWVDETFKEPRGQYKPRKKKTHE
jgi:hypothetical protein